MASSTQWHAKESRSVYSGEWHASSSNASWRQDGWRDWQRGSSAWASNPRGHSWHDDSASAPTWRHTGFHDDEGYSSQRAQSSMNWIDFSGHAEEPGIGADWGRWENRAHVTDRSNEPAEMYYVANWRQRGTDISKTLITVLRHTAVELGVPIRTDGYAPVPAVLQSAPLAPFQCTEDELVRVVHENDKQRYQLAEMDGVLHVRATQGHSMREVDDGQLLENLQPIDNVPASIRALPVAVHGTYLAYWDSIKIAGLWAGGPCRTRNHVHFAQGLPSEGHVISGMRPNCDLAIYLDVELALEWELPLFMSANGVIVTPGFDGLVPIDLFAKAINLMTGVELNF